MKEYSTEDSILYTNDEQILLFMHLLKDLHKKNFFYEELLENVNFSQPNENFLEIYAMLPEITKNIIKNNYEKYISEGFNSSVTSVELTSGTTGIPMRCIKTLGERKIKALNIWSQRKKHDESLRPENFYDLLGKSRLNSIDFTNTQSDNMKQIMLYLKEVSPTWLCSSPSLIYRYAQFLDENPRFKQSSINFIELQGESMSKEKRVYVENIFNAKTIMNYGNRESWCIAYECPHGHLHVMDKLCMLEAKRRPGEDDESEIIITDLINRIMPFVRYNTGDVGKVEEFDVCECGKVDGINITLTEGRAALYIKGHPNLIGNLVFKRIIHNVIRSRNKDATIINSFKVVQKTCNDFVYFIVLGHNGKKIKNEIEKEIISLTQNMINDAKVKVDFVDYIPLSTSGKSVLFEIDENYK